EKLTVNNNQLAVKYTLLLKEPTKKFLVYIPHPKPDDIDNWFLDLELAYHVYNTDQQALFLQELGLEYHLKEWVTNHLEFFQSKQRLQDLGKLVDKDDTPGMLTVKLMQVVFNAEVSDLDFFLRQYTVVYV